MAVKSIFNRLHVAGILACWSLVAATPALTAQDFPFFPMRFGFQGKVQTRGTEPGLVNVTMVTRFRGAKDTVEINGRLLTDYSPLIIQSFSSTGIVLDHKGHVMTLLGYRWLDIQNHDTSIEVSKDGQKWKGRLVGIDQRNGVAVIRLTGGKPKKTPTCDDFEVKDGTTIMAPVSSETSRLQQAQIVSIAEPATPRPEGWMITVDRPFPDIWQPILTSDHRVFGFIVSQDPLGMSNIVPISPLLASADKILETGGDIHAGWLGLYVDSDPAAASGVLVKRVEPDSPAQDAGFAPGDLLLKYNGWGVRDSFQFVDLVEESPIGSKAKIEIVRQGNPMTLSASIAARRFQPAGGILSFNLPGVFGLPVSGTIPDPAPSNQRLLIGVHTNYLDPPLAQFLQLPVRNGLLVSEVVKDSPADRAGILIGDVIVSIDGQAIMDAPAFASFLQTHDWGSRALIRVNRKGIEHTITVQLPD